MVEPVTRGQIAGMMWARLSERVEQVEALERDGIRLQLAEAAAELTRMEEQYIAAECARAAAQVKLAEAERVIQAIRDGSISRGDLIPTKAPSGCPARAGDAP